MRCFPRCLGDPETFQLDFSNGGSNILSGTARKGVMALHWNVGGWQTGIEIEFTDEEEELRFSHLIVT